tara:strand:+ start:5433 stop:5699 length:267 start_codon:yes stop_codon:yes gene_type:complete
VKISAYIPCFNKEETIGAVIRSIKNQTISVKQLFVCGDESNDPSVKICKKLGIILIAIPNWEWFDGNNPLWKLCDLFLCTSKFTEKVV